MVPAPAAGPGPGRARSPRRPHLREAPAGAQAVDLHLVEAGDLHGRSRARLFPGREEAEGEALPAAGPHPAACGLRRGGRPVTVALPLPPPRVTGEAEETRGTAGSAGSAAHSEAAPLPPHPWALPAVPALPGVGMGGEGRSRGGREPSSQGSACVRIQRACLSDRSVHRAGCGVILHGLHVNSGMQEFFLQPWWRRLI